MLQSKRCGQYQNRDERQYLASSPGSAAGGSKCLDPGDSYND